MAAHDIDHLLKIVDVKAHLKAIISETPLCNVHQMIELISENVDQKFKDELKDYFAHEIMIFGKHLKEHDQELLLSFFKYIFEEKVKQRMAK